MRQKQDTAVCWGLGLSDSQKERLQTYLGQQADFSFWPETHVPGLEAMEQAKPCMLWLSMSALRALGEAPHAQTRHLELLPRVLLLDDDYSLQDFEEAGDSGISDIVRPPFDKKRLRSVFRAALEAHAVHHDFMCMTREILLERELLERKNELMTFLVNFLTDTGASLDTESLLLCARRNLGMLFPVRALHAAIISHDEEDPSVALHISAPTDSIAMNIWRGALLQQLARETGQSCTAECHELRPREGERSMSVPLPSDGHLFALPLVTGGETIGVLLLLTEMERNLGRDQAQALESALGHLALALKNARIFRRMRQHADYDALTNLHSRRHFEERLRQEVERAERYGQTLSLAMLDIDHFKKINDTYGHHTGDIALREVALVIASAIRTTDYCARYGGEEFCILLPGTDGHNAAILAERLRGLLARHKFVADGTLLRLTTSIGIACVQPEDLKDGLECIRQADTALYEAKATGRNRVCAYFPQQESILASA